MSAPDRTADVPVLIAGAGPVGLSLALGLSRHGVRSLVVEKDAGLAEHSRAAAVAARTMEIFRRLPDAVLAGSSGGANGPALLLGDDESGSAGWPLAAIESAVEGLGVSVHGLLVTDVRAADSALRVTSPAVAEAVPPGRALLLRPDHHVGWIGDGPTPEAIRAGIGRALG